MAIGLVMSFDGVTKDQYEAACGPNGLDLKTPGNPNASDEWPEGVISHHAGPSPSGWVVVDTWESQAHFDKFLESRLGPAIGQAGIPQPKVTPFEIYNSKVL